MRSDISVVFVLYHPNKEDLRCVYAVSENYQGAIFDNSETRNIKENHINAMQYLWQGKNLGIAKAQNIAIQSLPNSKYVVFLDQDSRQPIHYPEQIVDEYRKTKEEFPNLAILGPVYTDGVSDDSYKSKIHKDVFLSPTIICRKNIISSGSCVGRDVFDDVGYNEEDLFIDLVDSEWCWRAVSKGYLCCMSTNVTITHTIGNKRISVGPFKDVVSSSGRYYYQYRNYLWMLFRGYVPLKWKICVGVKNILRLFYLPFFINNGCRSCVFMIKGTLAGILSFKKNRK